MHDTRKKKVPPERYVKPDDILINSTGAGTAGRIAQIEDVPSATTIDGHIMLDAALRNTRIEMSPSERRQFYDKHIKHMTLTIDENGNVSIELKRG